MNWYWYAVIAAYVFVGFVIGHKTGPSFKRYAWVDYRILGMCLVGWPFILFHDWWINRDVVDRSQKT